MTLRAFDALTLRRFDWLVSLSNDSDRSAPVTSTGSATGVRDVNKKVRLKRGDELVDGDTFGESRGNA